MLCILSVCVTSINAQKVIGNLRYDTLKIGGPKSGATQYDGVVQIFNSTKDVAGFLYNQGNGVTKFVKSLTKVNDSTWIIGVDTLFMKSIPNGTSKINVKNGIGDTLAYLNVTKDTLKVMGLNVGSSYAFGATKVQDYTNNTLTYNFQPFGNWALPSTVTGTSGNIFTGTQLGQLIIQTSLSVNQSITLPGGVIKGGTLWILNKNQGSFKYSFTNANIFDVFGNQVTQLQNGTYFLQYDGANWQATYMSSLAEGQINLANLLGVLPIAKGGTGATTKVNALNNLLPTQTSAVGGFFLQTDGSGNISWQPASGGSGGTQNLDNVLSLGGVWGGNHTSSFSNFSWTIDSGRIYYSKQPAYVNNVDTFALIDLRMLRDSMALARSLIPTDAHIAATAPVQTVNGQIGAVVIDGTITHLSASTNITITGTGTTGSPYVISASGTGGSTTLAGLTDVSVTSPTNLSALVYNVSASKWVDTLFTTTLIPEGTNLYWTNARFDARFATASVTYWASQTTDNLAEGTTNLYFTNTRARAAISVSGLPLTYTAGVISINQSNTSTAGYLSAADWNTFNGKFATPTGATTQYIRGNGTLATTDTAMIPSFFAKVRSEFTAGTSISVANGVIAFTGTIPAQFNATQGYGVLITGSYPNQTFKFDSATVRKLDTLFKGTNDTLYFAINGGPLRKIKLTIGGSSSADTIHLVHKGLWSFYSSAAGDTLYDKGFKTSADAYVRTGTDSVNFVILKANGVTAGTYTGAYSVDSTGRITAASNSGGSVTNLTNTPAPTLVAINSSTGTPTNVLGATHSLAGVLTAADKTRIDSTVHFANGGGSLADSVFYATDLTHAFFKGFSLTGGIDLLIDKTGMSQSLNSYVFNSDTTTGAGHLSTQGFVTRNFPTMNSGSQGNITFWRNGTTLSNVSIMKYDTTNSRVNFTTAISFTGTTPTDINVGVASGNATGISYVSGSQINSDYIPSSAVVATVNNGTLYSQYSNTTNGGNVGFVFQSANRNGDAFTTYRDTAQTGYGGFISGITNKFVGREVYMIAFGANQKSFTSNTQLLVIDSTGVINLPHYAGGGLGTQMMTVDANGVVGVQAIPSGGGTFGPVSGTTNRITVATGSTAPVIDISNSYAGQGSIGTVGTVVNGIWQATVVAPGFGGTGLSSYTAFALIAGGTTSTGVLQQISNAGAVTNYVLTYNGSGALPTWQPSQGAGGISALTGDGTASGSGSVPLTLSTVNANVFASQASVKVTVNAKGLITSAALITSADLTAIFGYTPLSGNQTITLGGDLSGSGNTSITAAIVANAVTYAKMQQAGPLKVIGNPNLSTGNLQEMGLGGGITVVAGNLTLAAVPNSSLANSTITIGSTDFSGSGTISLGGTFTLNVNGGAITYNKIQNETAQTLLGRFANTNGSPQEITVGGGLALNVSTGVLSTAIVHSSGTYIPTTTLVSGTATINTANAIYSQAGNIITVSGTFQVNSPTAGTLEVQVSLPPGLTQSGFVLYGAAGYYVTGVPNAAYVLNGSLTSQHIARVGFSAPTTITGIVNFTFQYSL